MLNPARVDEIFKNKSRKMSNVGQKNLAYIVKSKSGTSQNTYSPYFSNKIKYKVIMMVQDLLTCQT